MTVKTPTPQGISALLRKAGFKRASYLGGRWGHRTRTAGYVVTGIAEAPMMPWQGVCVRFVFGSFTAHNGEQLCSYLDQYAKAITARGYVVRLSDTSLTVTASED